MLDRDTMQAWRERQETLRQQAIEDAHRRVERLPSRIVGRVVGEDVQVRCTQCGNWHTTYPSMPLQFFCDLCYGFPRTRGDRPMP
jgi:ribosomal protein S27E